MRRKAGDKKLGRRIKNLRAETGLTALEVGQAIGYKSDNSVRIWEGGLRPVSRKGLMLLAGFFGVRLGWLMSGEGDKYSDSMGSGSFAEQLITTKVNERMVKITERYTNSLEVKMTAIPRLVELLEKIEELAKAGADNAVIQRQDPAMIFTDEYMAEVLTVLILVRRVVTRALQGESGFARHRLIEQGTLRKIKEKVDNLFEEPTTLQLKKMVAG